MIKFQTLTTVVDVLSKNFFKAVDSRDKIFNIACKILSTSALKMAEQFPRQL